MKNFKHKHLIVFCTLIFTKIAVAQDEHLTQFYQNEASVNPSLTGGPDGRLRISANSKQQWNSIASPYTTSVFVVDKSVVTTNKMSMSGGLIFMADKAGDANLRTRNVAATVSAKIKTNRTTMLGAGLQIGWVQKSISLNGLSWDAQYNGKFYDASLSNNELSNAATFSNIRIATGLSYIVNRDKYHKYKIGISGFHLSQNKNSFYGNDNEKLYSRYNLFASGEFGNENTNISYLPSLLTQIQGPNFTIIGGMLVSYRMGFDSRNTNVNKSSALLWGVHYRFADAIIPSIHYEYRRKLRFGLSYDINISKLTPATFARGGFELSFNYFVGDR
jgi:type IX secretion system PorP/SprF family membrane protein